MNKTLLIVALSGLAVAACTENVIQKAADPAPAPTTDPGMTMEPTEPPPDAGPDAAAPTSDSKAPEDRCLDGQDMNAEDIDITKCPVLPSAPDDTPMGKETISLGAWEMGTTVNKDTYVYGTLSAPGTNPRVLKFDGGSAPVNDKNVECWAKGYYRLRKILQTAPAEYVALHKAGFQYRFFQFQSDLRNGPTGYKEISSFQDHLVKWVTVIDKAGVCQQPTLAKFKAYAKEELMTRGLPVPK